MLDDGVRAENVHVHAGRGGHGAARSRDGGHHKRRFGDAQPGATIFTRHGDAEPSSIRHRLVEFMRETALAVAFQPIIVTEPANGCRHPADDRLLIVR